MKCRLCGGVVRVIKVSYTSLSSQGIRTERGLTYYDSGQRMNQGSEMTERIGRRRGTIRRGGNFLHPNHRTVNLNRYNSRPIQQNQNPNPWPTTEELYFERTRAFIERQKSKAKFKEERAGRSAFNTGLVEQRI